MKNKKNIMKKFLLWISLALMALNASANSTANGTKDKPTNDTTFRVDTTSILNGRSLIAQRLTEGWSLYNASRLDEESVEITFYRLNGSKSAINSGKEDYDEIPDGTYESYFRLLSGKMTKIVIVVKDGKVVSHSSENLP